MLKFAGKLAALMIFFGLFLSPAAQAENRAGAVILTPMAGFHLFDGGLDLDDGAAVGLGLGFNITPEWGIEADLRYTPTESTVSGADLDLDVWSFGLSGLYHFQPAADLNPYLAVGLGGMVYDFEDTSRDDEDFMGYWGGGFKYALCDYAALRLDLRHILDFRSDNRGRNDDSSSRHHLSAMLGVAFQFGGFSSQPVPVRQAAAPVEQVTPAPATLLDSDHDGVPDDRDACPDTPQKTRVDARGCAERPEQPEQPEQPKQPASLTLNLQFDLDQARITDAHASELSLAADFIARHANYDIVVAGHTDDQGEAAYNRQLAQRRAENVRQALIDGYDIAPQRIRAIGYGEIKPIASNATAEGRAANRRVEINVLSR